MSNKQGSSFSRSFKKKSKKAMLIFLAGFFPMLAGIFKSFTYSFGAMNFINFFYLGSTTLSIAAFSGPFFPLICILGFSIFLITLGMEGKSLYKTVGRKLNEWLDILPEKNEPDSSEPLPVWRQKINRVISPIIRGVGVIMPFLAASTKGFASAIATMSLLFGCYSLAAGIPIATLGIGSLLALGPPGIAILCIGVVAGISITAISLAKEGRTFYGSCDKAANKLSMEMKPVVFHKTIKETPEKHPTLSKTSTNDKGPLSSPNSKPHEDNADFERWRTTKNTHSSKVQNSLSHDNSWSCRRSAKESIASHPTESIPRQVSAF